MIKPVLDSESLREIGEVVRQVIAEAVRAGFHDALGDWQDDQRQEPGDTS